MIDFIMEFLLQLNWLSGVDEEALLLIVQIGTAVVIFLFFLFLRNIFVKYILSAGMRMFKRSESIFIRYFVCAFEGPLKIFLIVLGTYLALIYMPLPTEADIFINRIFRSILIILIAIGINKFIKNTETIYEELQQKHDLHAEKITIPFVSKVAQGIIVALAFIVIVQEWNYNVGGFIAGLGLGGLAFALAAQDTLGNFFGGFVIITDKPFTIGDWIRTPSVEGSVEDINLRNTKVRSFEKGIVTVPNGTLANEPITNFTKRDARRITFALGVTYSTPKEKLERCVERIRGMLEEHPGVCKESSLFVRFDAFGASSLDIFIYFFTNTIVWAEFLKIKEDINFKIMQILEEEGVEVAFPSRSIYFENQLESIEPPDK